VAIRVVHYLNQFFGQIGGEEKADTKPMAKEGPVGPGTALNNLLGEEAEVVGTVICGDSYFNENLEEARTKVLELIKGFQPNVLVAGPAFNAGRYGTACGTVCSLVKERLGIPVLTGMYPENPGVDMFKRDVIILKTKDSAAGMREALPQMARLILKLAKGEELGVPEEEGYIPRGIRKNYFADKRGSERAVETLIKKLRGEEFKTEYPMPDFDRVEPQPPVEDVSRAKIALVTSGGIVPKGNPDSIEASSASKYAKYDISGVDDLTPDEYETAHGGYDPTYANEDPDRVLPIDVMRQLEKEGVIGKLHDYYYVTVGNGTSVANAKKYAQEFAKELVKDGVQAVILTST